MAIADNRLIASFWDTASSTWTDFRVTTYNTSTNAYVYSTTAASSVQSCNIVDKLYTPKKLLLELVIRLLDLFLIMRLQQELKVRGQVKQGNLLE